MKDTIRKKGVRPMEIVEIETICEQVTVIRKTIIKPDVEVVFGVDTKK
ncbi:MAG: hypothetical protein ABH879_05055 [archaeon]